MGQGGVALGRGRLPHVQDGARPACPPPTRPARRAATASQLAGDLVAADAARRRRGRGPDRAESSRPWLPMRRTPSVEPELARGARAGAGPRSPRRRRRRRRRAVRVTSRAPGTRRASAARATMGDRVPSTSDATSSGPVAAGRRRTAISSSRVRHTTPSSARNRCGPVPNVAAGHLSRMAIMRSRASFGPHVHCLQDRAPQRLADRAG